MLNVNVEISKIVLLLRRLPVNYLRQRPSGLPGIGIIIIQVHYLVKAPNSLTDKEKAGHKNPFLIKNIPAIIKKALFIVVNAKSIFLQP
jgi:hypothetical protein